MSMLTVTHKEMISMYENIDTSEDFLNQYLEFTSDTISSGTYRNDTDGCRVFNLGGHEVATFFHDDKTIEYSFEVADEPFFLAAFIAAHIYAGGTFTEYHLDRLSDNFRGI